MEQNVMYYDYYSEDISTLVIHTHVYMDIVQDIHVVTVCHGYLIKICEYAQTKSDGIVINVI